MAWRRSVVLNIWCGVPLLVCACDAGAPGAGDQEDPPDVGEAAVGDVAQAEFPSPDVVPEPEEEPFSFFVTSLEGLREVSGSMDGFGGDLGGLEGADGICQQLAATVDAGHKTWRAFLSATQGPDGNPVHAIDRIGEGPWYDRNGRLVAANKEDLVQERPVGDPQVVDDLPNEYGQGQKQYGDNHDTLTGSNAQGRLNDTDPASTCQDWTSSVGPGSEKRVMGGHSWPRDDQTGGGGPAGAGPGGGGPAGAGPGGGGPAGAGPGGGGPIAPPPWVNACNGLDEGDTCNVATNKKTFEGTCSVHPEDDSIILCMPPDGNLPGGGGGGGGDTGEPWIAAHTVPGCAPGVELEQTGGGKDTDTVGGGGGYGGIYCFALEP